jgi:acetyl-CoA C-acetyltransferase
MTDRQVWTIAAVRTAIGTFGGSLKDVPLPELATTAVKAALQRSDVSPTDVGHVVLGNVIPTETRDAYLSRVAAMNAGIPKETPASPRKRRLSMSTVSADPDFRPSCRRHNAFYWAKRISRSAEAPNP